MLLWMHSKQTFVLIVIGQLTTSCCRGWTFPSFSAKAPKPNTSSNNNNQNSNVNFEDWIANAPQETSDWNPLEIQGTIPSYVQGTLIRNGGGMWTQGNTELSHIFDGLAKLNAYRIGMDGGEDNKDGRSVSVSHQTKFLKGNWWKRHQDSEDLLPAIATGPVLDSETKQVKEGTPLRILQAVYNVATAFDNTPPSIFGIIVRPAMPKLRP
ncbi:hypothetical protein ACHAXR_003560 [Thalassiosira sp. AJA248-18]